MSGLKEAQDVLRENIPVAKTSSVGIFACGKISIEE